MKIYRTNLILGIVGPRSRSLRDFEIFLHLRQYKLSGPITQLWYKLGSFLLSMYVHLVLIYKIYEYRHA